MQDHDIPIDIHTNKLLDWMISRKVCTRDWQNSVLTIREKINNAIQDMPVHQGITQLLTGSYINYFHCKIIISILRETEVSSKNFFGSYGSQRMKDWLEIVKLYEKDKVYLAEAAQMLIRNVNYEVPALKKEIIHCESLLTECEKREVLRSKSIHVAHNEFETVRKSLGIKGQKIKKELLTRTSELPEIYSDVAKSTKAIEDACVFYSEFVKFTTGKEYPGGCIPILKYIIDKGNTTTYEWSTGKVPAPRPNFDPNVVKDHDDDSDDETKQDTNGINFVEIDFGDLGISVVDDVNSNIDFGNGIVVDVVDSSCTNEQYTSLLDNVKTRGPFVDDLKELEAFLKARLHELKDANDVLTLTQMQDAPTILQLQTLESVGQMMDKLQSVLTKITNPITHHLHNIKYSPRYVDNLTNSLQQKLNAIDKLEAMKGELILKQRETLDHIKIAQPKLKLIIEKTRELQGEIEQEISKIYKNRPVNIMGSVNVM